MIGALFRGVFYLSFVALIAVAAWAYSTAKTWQEIAAAADRTQATAAKVAKAAVDRADRCVSELKQSSETDKKPEPVRKSAAL